MSLSSAPPSVSNLTPGDVVTLENDSGSQATIRIEQVFSSRVFITQLDMDGLLDLTGEPYLTPTELARYDIHRRPNYTPD